MNNLIKKSKKTTKTTKSKKTKKSRSDRDLILTKHLKPYNNNNTSSHIPDYKIYHKPSNSSIIMNIKLGQSVFANYGLMVWKDRDIEVSTKTRGLFAAFKRTIFSTDSFFLISYSGTSLKGNKICFAPMMTGDIIEIKIKPGEQKLVSSNSIVVCSDNIILDSRVRLRGIFVSESPFLSELSVPANSKEYGIAWISAYGGIETIDVKNNQIIQVDGGHFLSCDGDTQYTIGDMGNIKSTLFSGAGLLMNFTGPCKIHIQNRNSHSLLKWIASKNKQYIDDHNIHHHLYKKLIKN
jgi:uncharacterized protein (TIGR00266 family)